MGEEEEVTWRSFTFAFRNGTERQRLQTKLPGASALRFLSFQQCILLFFLLLFFSKVKKNMKSVAMNTNAFSGVRTALPARSKVSITRPRQGLNQVSSRTQRNTIRTHAGNSPDTFPRDWLKKDNFPLICGFLAWTIPSSIPVGSFGGESLFWRLNESIKIGFDNFPTGPGVTDPFWIYMLTWHIGLFVTLTLAKI